MHKIQTKTSYNSSMSKSVQIYPGVTDHKRSSVRAAKILDTFLQLCWKSWKHTAWPQPFRDLNLGFFSRESQIVFWESWEVFSEILGNFLGNLRKSWEISWEFLGNFLGILEKSWEIWSAAVWAGNSEHSVHICFTAICSFHWWGYLMVLLSNE